MRILGKLGITDKASLFAFVKQFFLFGVVGVFNTLVALGVYYLLLYFSVYYIVAYIASYVLGTLNAYFWNSRFVFKKKGVRGAKPLVKVFALYGFTGLLANALLYVWVDFLDISEWFAPLINLCITVPANFLLNKFWAFEES